MNANARNAAILILAGLLGLALAAALRYLLMQGGMSQVEHLGSLLLAGAAVLVVGAGCGYWSKAKGYQWWVGMFFGSIGTLTCVGLWIFIVIMLYVPTKDVPE